MQRSSESGWKCDSSQTPPRDIYPTCYWRNLNLASNVLFRGNRVRLPLRLPCPSQSPGGGDESWGLFGVRGVPHMRVLVPFCCSPSLRGPPSYLFHVSLLIPRHTRRRPRGRQEQSVMGSFGAARVGPPWGNKSSDHDPPGFRKQGWDGGKVSVRADQPVEEQDAAVMMSKVRMGKRIARREWLSVWPSNCSGCWRWCCEVAIKVRKVQATCWRQKIRRG
ncbi:hypothetical protein V8C35DRAFT_306605 [Trichoderma chlorosporum]